MTISKLSKSDYTLGLQCPLALWFKYKRKDLKPPITPQKQALFDTGNEVGEWARKYFDDNYIIGSNKDNCKGYNNNNYNNQYCDRQNHNNNKNYLIDAPCWHIDESILQTKEGIDFGSNYIFEATAKTPEGLYSRIDVLRKCENDSSNNKWDLMEAKSSTKLKEYQIDDISFQYYVFKNAGYEIRDCYIMLVNNEYIKNGDINPKELLKLKCITEQVLEKYNTIKDNADYLLSKLNEQNKLEQDIGCHCNSPFECDYKHECWKHIPKYSVFDLYTEKEGVEQIYKCYGADIRNIPEEKHPINVKNIDIRSYLEDKEHINKEEIKSFLNTLEYPLYFLDYETVAHAVPPFNNSRPYQQIPFQFSLHVQEGRGEQLKHIEYLHKNRTTDPRKSLTQKLIESCKDKGSILVYYENFEKTRNKELAELFPEYKEQLENINNRIVDLYTPFKNRHIYNHKQKSSASIKYTLPAFTDMTYQDMEIKKGDEASNRYLKYLQNKLNKEEENTLFKGLDNYCKQDTLAMVKLLEVLEEKIINRAGEGNGKKEESKESKKSKENNKDNKSISNKNNTNINSVNISVDLNEQMRFEL
ncbi:DUF2779 domain-containing protein [Pseudomonadota bacterium]